MRFCLTYIFLVFCLFTKSQNYINVTTDYITNPSFEDYTACPQSYSSPGNLWIDSCNGWSSATYATSDYLNACANGIYPLAGVPNNFPMVNQMAFDGNGYCGFAANSLVSSLGGMWCEYIKTDLKQILKAGKKYRLQMRLAPSKLNFYGIAKIGAHFSTQQLATGFQETSFKFTPTIINTKGVISDTTKWFLFDEEFIANGSEKVLTIGWFCDTLTNDNGYFDSSINETIYGSPYYAIDSLNFLIEEKMLPDIKEFDFNILTPNNDGINDFIDFTKYNLSYLNFTVYNRWGNKVFESNNSKLKWNAINQSNENLKDGVYYFILEANQNETTSKTKGFITIIK